MNVICGSDLYKGEVCYTNLIDFKLYPSARDISDVVIKDLFGYYRVADDLKSGESAKVKQKKVYKL